ncbi:MAG: UDP-glucose dehydrogenase family protein [Acidobacteriota bacterium]
MKISVMGAGYVGLVTGACFAETGNDVICADIDEARIESLKQAKPPIYEPGLEELIRRNLEEQRLQFTTDIDWAVKNALIVFIAVGTPPGEDGASDLGYVLNAARQIGKAMDGYKIIAIKSTVPVGSADLVRQEIAALTRFQFDVVSNPEFLKEGAAIDDFMKPDRVVIGAEEVRAAEIIKELYAPFTRTGAPIYVMDRRSSEMTKYAANAMLASRISFMNEIANLCEHVGADVHWVRQGVGSDRRVGPSFLFPGVGYGGSCFPKDIKALIAIAKQCSYPLKLVTAIEEVNELQKQVLVEKILRFYSSELAAQLETSALPGIAQTVAAASEMAVGANKSGDDTYFLSLDKIPESRINNQSLYIKANSVAEATGYSENGSPIEGKTFALWGLSFKPQTDDIREAPSLVVIGRLLELGAKIQAYDPEAMQEAKKRLGDRIQYASNNYEALRNAHALILLTEWNLFRNPNFQKIKSLLKFPVIFDGRNQYSPQEMRELGFVYFGIGRQ